MKVKCPYCGHSWDSPTSQQSRAGKARWRDVDKLARQEAMRALARRRYNKKNPDNHSPDSPP